MWGPNLHHFHGVETTNGEINVQIGWKSMEPNRGELEPFLRHVSITRCSEEITPAKDELTQRNYTAHKETNCQERVSDSVWHLARPPKLTPELPKHSLFLPTHSIPSSLQL